MWPLAWRCQSDTALCWVQLVDSERSLAFYFEVAEGLRACDVTMWPREQNSVFLIRNNNWSSRIEYREWEWTFRKPEKLNKCSFKWNQLIRLTSPDHFNDCFSRFPDFLIRNKKHKISKFQLLGLKWNKQIILRPHDSFLWLSYLHFFNFLFWAKKWKISQFLFVGFKLKQLIILRYPESVP